MSPTPIQRRASALPRRRWLTAATILVATAALFSPTLDHAFLNFDDDVYVTANPRVRTGLSPENLLWAWTALHAANWHPLTWISHMLDCELYGLDPRGHHASNVLLHALNATLVFVALERATGRAGRSALVAALFAVHPVQVEPVAWIAERKELLAAFFGWIALVFYFERARGGPLRSTTVATMALLLALSLAAKPMWITTPVLLLLVDYWPLGRFRTVGWRRLLLEKTPLLALSTVSAAITWAAQTTGGAVGTLERYPAASRLANAVASYGLYVLKTAWPNGLAVFYPHPANGVPGGRVAAVALLLLALSLLAVRYRRKLPYLLVGWSWFAVALLPVIGLVQVGEQARADRYLYLPSIGLFLLVVWGAGDALSRSRRSRMAGVPAAVVVVALLSLATRSQIRFWQDSVTLFTRALDVSADNPTARLNLAMALSDRGEPRASVEHYRAALRMRPHDPKIHHNLGVALDRIGRTAEADSRYRRALSLREDYADAHFSLGLSLERRQRFDEAYRHFRAAHEIEPDFARAHYACGTLLVREGRLDEAGEHFARAAEIAPDLAEARYNLALVLHHQGHVERARAELAAAERWGYTIPPAVRSRVLGRAPERGERPDEL